MFFFILFFFHQNSCKRVWNLIKKCRILYQFKVFLKMTFDKTLKVKMSSEYNKRYLSKRRTSSLLSPLSGGDVHRPGDERYAEAASPSLAPRGQAGDARRCRVRAALHPRHGRHRHLLHYFTKRSLQDTGEHHRWLWFSTVDQLECTLGSFEPQYLLTNMILHSDCYMKTASQSLHQQMALARVQKQVTASTGKESKSSTGSQWMVTQVP